jgi:hypothetical protein
VHSIKGVVELGDASVSQGVNSEEMLSGLIPLESLRAGFDVKSLSIAHKASAYSDDLQPHISINGTCKGASFASLNAIGSETQHTEFDVSIEAIPHQWELKDDELSKGLITVKIFSGK